MLNFEGPECRYKKVEISRCRLLATCLTVWRPSRITLQTPALTTLTFTIQSLRVRLNATSWRRDSILSASKAPVALSGRSLPTLALSRAARLKRPRPVIGSSVRLRDSPTLLVFLTVSLEGTSLNPAAPLCVPRSAPGARRRTGRRRSRRLLAQRRCAPNRAQRRGLSQAQRCRPACLPGDAPLHPASASDFELL